MDYNVFNEVANELVGIYNLCKGDTCLIGAGVAAFGASVAFAACGIPEYFQTRKANKIFQKDNKLERSLN